MTADAHELAARVAEAMYAKDHAARHLGIKVKEVGPGYAVLTMKVEPYMVNGHDICHGGMTFALADTAFAYACNARNEATVAAGCLIDYLAPAHQGDVLTATAQETAKGGRQGIYDITVTNQEGVTVATFRGRAASLRKPVIE
jgi:acyl-CoA thioesterase